MSENPAMLCAGYFERLCQFETLADAFKAVKRNKGAPGVDKVTIELFESKLSDELLQLQKELQEWVYNPMPVRRVEIPKPNGGVRLLGVPAVRDRVVQAACKAILEPVFEATFSESSYGFRPRRNQEQAVKAAQEIVRSGKAWVVDIDLSQFFDRIHHDRLIARIKLQMPDTRILRLIGKILRSGVMQGGLVSLTTEGAPQGGPLSPLLSNIVLDELDKELERRGLEFCRFADDCNIFVGTEQSATRVMRTVTKFIETKLKLIVNQDKSKVAQSRFVKFLGMTIVSGFVAIAPQAIDKAMAKTRELIPRGTSEPIEQTVSRINEWYVGWANYFKMTQYPSQLLAIEAHLRRRLRSRIVSQQKRKRHLYEKLLKRGVPRRKAAIVYSNRKRWALSHSQAVETGYPNRWFIKTLGLKVASHRNLDHWFPTKTWIKLREKPCT